MRISEMNIDGFGQFADKKFGPLEQPVTVFFGPNEAGKSTLLAFIRTVLYGFRPRTNNYPPLVGGRHGGRVTLVSQDGHRSVVSRFKGPRSGKVTVTSETGALQDEAALAQMLGNSSWDVFKQVFAFTLDELHSDLLENENVNNQIFSVGMGVTSLPNIMKSIGNERDGIFLARGRTKKINNTYKELQDIDGKLRRVEENTGRYGDLVTRQQQVETELAALVASRRRIQSHLDHQKRLQSAWDPWNDMVSIQREMETLPVIDKFPVDGTSRLETLEERVSNAQREFESAEDRVSEAGQAADIQVEHENILQHSSDIRRLQEGRTDFDGLIRDLPDRLAELRESERTLAETLRDLGPDWDETRLEKFDLSLAVRQEIAEQRDRLRDISETLSSQRSSHNQNEITLKETKEAEEQAYSKFQSSIEPSLNAEQIRLRRNLIRSISSRLNELDSERQNVTNLQNQLGGLESTYLSPDRADRSNVVVTFSLVIFGIALLVGGAILGGTALYIGIVAAVALGGLAGYLFMSGKSGSAVAGASPLASTTRESLRQSEAEIQDLQSRMLQEAAPLGLETIDKPSLLAAEASLDEEADRLQEWTRLTEALDVAMELTNQRQTRVEESVGAVEDTERQLISARREWQNWLRTRGLLDTFTPETADLLQKQIELGRSHLGKVRDWRVRIKDIENDIDEYVQIVDPLALSFSVAFDRNDGRSIAAAADRLVALLEQVRENVRRRSDTKEEMEAARRRLEDRRGELQEAMEELEQLFRSGGAENAENFRERAEFSERRKELESKSRTALDQLQRISGPGEALDLLNTDLEGTDPQSITNEIAFLEEERANVSTQHDHLLTERGSIQTDLANLASEEESSRLRMQRNILLEQLRGHAHDWSRLTLAHNLLNETRRKFERERQPDVVRHARKDFAAITGGRYQRLYAPLGEQTITVTDDSGQSKQPSELSRGTREQLFLALRFGLIRDLGQRTEPLPVIVDEVLVNFDPERAFRAAVAFTNLSATHQVLVFTCHPAIVKMFCDASSEAGTKEPQVLSFS